MKKLLYLLMFVFVGVTSCQKEELIQKNEELNTITQDVTVKDGILCFKNKEVYKNTIEMLSKMDRVTADSWEKSKNFVSQRNIFDQIVDAEWKLLVEPYEKMSTDELKKASTPATHSGLYEKCLKSGVIKKVRYSDNTESYDYNLFSGFFAKVVNEEGLCAIGDTIFQLTDVNVKMITNGDFSKINLLKKSNATDKVNNIAIISVISENKSAKSGNFDWNSSGNDWQATGNYYHSKRIRCEVWLTSDLAAPYTDCFMNYTVNVKTQRKNFWGNWDYYASDVIILANWTYQSTINENNTFNHQDDYFELNYYDHPSSMNNYWVSVYPTGGGTAPYPSTFVYSAPYNWYFSRQPQITNSIWWAESFDCIAQVYQ
jgi:hypothetical protein